MSDDTPAIDGDLLDAIADELRERYDARHAGDITTIDEQAITSGELADEITGENAEANPKTREAMKVLMRERGIPIVGDHRGNWIPLTEAPVENKLDNLDQRIDGIKERKRLLSENWRQWHGATATDGAGVESIPQAIRDVLTDEPVQRSSSERRTSSGSRPTPSPRSSTNLRRRGSSTRRARGWRWHE